MPFDDTPKRWIDEEEICDNTSQLMPIEEEKPLPTIAEQRDILNKSDLEEEDKGILGSLVEINNIANALEKTGLLETTEQRIFVIKTYAEHFIAEHLKNNIRAEDLKNRLLMKLSHNIDNLDLELASRIYLDLQQTMSQDVAIMNATAHGESNADAMAGLGGPSINLTVNNATTEGASITNNTLAVNNQQANLKDASILNNTIKKIQTVSMPRQKPTVTING
jgi:hypothetical protein